MLGTLDSQVIEKFQKFQEKTGKHLDLDIGNIEFELKNLFDIVSLSNGSEFPFGYVKRKDIQGNISLISAGTKTDIMGSIQSLKGNYSVYPEKHYVFNNTKNKWNEVTHYIGQDYYTLTADGVYGGTLILRKKEDYPNGFYTTNVCKVLNFIDDNVFEQYFLNAYKIEKEKHKFGFVAKANNDNLKKVFIPIPKDYNEKYKSIDIQRAIVEFLEYSFDNLQRIKKSINKRYKIVTEMKKSLIPSTFKKTAIKNTFKKYAKENHIEFDITDIEFDIKDFDLYVSVEKGKSKYTTKYINQNKGNYPLYSSGTDNETKGLMGEINTFDYDVESIQFTANGEKAGTIFKLEKHKFSMNGDRGMFVSKNNEIDLSFLYYNLKNEFLKHQFSWANKPTNTKIKEKIKIYIPKIDGYDSMQIEKDLANFIEYMNKEIDEKYFKKYNRFYEVVELLRETYLKRTFNKIVWN